MNRDCPACGMQVNILETRTCLKCDYPLAEHIKDEIHKVDVGDNGEDWETARHKILSALDRALLGGFAGLRVVHGYGSARGHTSSIRNHAIRLASQVAAKHHYYLIRGMKNKGETLVLFVSEKHD